jgi:23S rRNA U2552 (ribose-2'-O)-methylase RlmE/FtsJ
LQQARSELEINVIFDIRAAAGGWLQSPPLLKTIEWRIAAVDVDPMKKSLADQKSSASG